MSPHHESKQLYQLITRVPKKDSSFFYFTLESNEGLAFYSTLEESLGSSYRDIQLFCTPEFYPQVMQVISKCQESFSIEILKSELIADRVN